MKFWQKKFRQDMGFSNHLTVRGDRTGSARFEVSLSPHSKFSDIFVSVQCTKQIVLNLESNVSPPIKTLWIIKWRGPTVTWSWMFVFEEKLLKKLNHSQRIKIRKPQSFLKMFYTRKSPWKPVSVYWALLLEIRDPWVKSSGRNQKSTF